LLISDKSSESWCVRNFLDYQRLKQAEKIRGELLRIMEKLELPISEPVIDCEVLETSVKKALLAGYFTQVQELRFTPSLGVMQRSIIIICLSCI